MAQDSCCHRSRRKVRDAFRILPENATPVQWGTILVVIIALFGGAYSITFVFSFLPFLIVDLGYNEEDKGHYAGIIASGFFIGRVVASYFWGWLSDKKGRRFVIELNLIIMVFLTLAFGFTTSIWYAFIDRLLTGAFNAIVTVVKTILYEISDDTNQAVAMSAITASWGLGIVLGPTISGFLAKPTEKFWGIFRGVEFLEKFPYFLSCLVAAIIPAVACVVSHFKLPETLEQHKHDKNGECGEDHVCRCHKMMFADDVHTAGYIQSFENLTMFQRHVSSQSGEAILMVKSQEHLQSICGSDHHHNTRRMSISVPDLRQTVSNPPSVSVKLLDEAEDDEKLNGNKCRKCQKPTQRDLETIEEDKEETQAGWFKSFKKSTLYYLICQRDVQKVLLLYSLYSFCIIGSEEIFSVWASTETRLGGLGFSTSEVGLAVGASFLPVLILQLFVFPKVEKAFGAKKTCMGSCIINMILIQLLPVIPLLQKNDAWLWSLLLLISIPSRIAASCGFCSIALMINNSVSPTNAGQVNGLGVTTSAMTRAMAPVFAGSIFSWSVTDGATYGYPFDVNFVFFSFGVVFMICTVVCLSVPGRLNRQLKRVS